MRLIAAGPGLLIAALVLAGCGKKSADPFAARDGKKSEVKTLVAEKAPADDGPASDRPESAGQPATTRDEAMKRQLAAGLAKDLDTVTDSMDRAEILAKVKELGPAAKALWERLVAALKDEDPSTRAASLDALVSVDPAAARPYLEMGFKDAEAEVRQMAAEAWATAGIKDIHAILRAVPEEVSPRVQHAMMLAVEKVADASLVVAIADVIESLDPSAAKPAVRFLVTHRAKDQGAKLIDLVNKNDAEVRVLAAQALATLEVKSKPALLALVRALTDEIIGVRRAAFDSLKSLTGNDLPYDPDDVDEIQQGAKGWRDWVEKNS